MRSSPDHISPVELFSYLSYHNKMARLLILGVGCFLIGLGGLLASFLAKLEPLHQRKISSETLFLTKLHPTRSSPDSRWSVSAGKCLLHLLLLVWW